MLVHGYLCNRGFWNPWLRMLREREHPFVAVSLEPVFGTIDAYVAPIEAAVRKLTALTGRPPVLVCHSMGGLAARAWARRLGVDPQGHTRSAAIISIGSPHAGTWMARFSSAHNCRQMRLQSQWLDQLGRSETSAMRRQMICWYSNCDNIVFPATSATLAGADNRLVTGVAHMALAFDLRVVQPSLAKIASL